AARLDAVLPAGRRPRSLHISAARRRGKAVGWGRPPQGSIGGEAFRRGPPRGRRAARDLRRPGGSTAHHGRRGRTSRPCDGWHRPGLRLRPVEPAGPCRQHLAVGKPDHTRHARAGEGGGERVSLLAAVDWVAWALVVARVAVTFAALL